MCVVLHHKVLLAKCFCLGFFISIWVVLCWKIIASSCQGLLRNVELSLPEKTTATLFELCFKCVFSIKSLLCRIDERTSRDLKWKRASSTVLVATKVALFEIRLPAAVVSNAIEKLINYVACYWGLQIKSNKKNVLQKMQVCLDWQPVIINTEFYVLSGWLKWNCVTSDERFIWNRSKCRCCRYFLVVLY